MPEDTEYVKGLDALLGELKGLPGNIEANALRTSIAKSAKFLGERIQEAAPVSSGEPPKGGRFKNLKPGTLKASIKSKRRRGRKGEARAGITGSFYAKWVELGHVLKGHKPNKEVIGHVPPNNFIMRAFEANKDEAVEIAKRELVAAVKKGVERLRRKMFKP